MPGKLPVRLQRMIAATRAMEFVTTHTEVEAGDGEQKEEKADKKSNYQNKMGKRQHSGDTNTEKRRKTRNRPKTNGGGQSKV